MENSQYTTESTVCCFCSSQHTHLHYQEKEWKIVKCDNCGLCFTNPRPSIASLPLFYNEEYFKDKRHYKGYYNQDGTVKLNDGEYGPRVVSIENFLSQRGSILELGAARGGFLKVMRDRGWTVDGVEISSEAVEIGKKLYDIHLFNGMLEDYKTDKKYDVICMYQTLEHVYNPAYVIKRSHELLHKGGLLVIEVPNIDSADMWFNEERKHLTYDLPRHLTHFSPATLSKYLLISGFNIEHIELAYPTFLNRLLALRSKKQPNVSPATTAVTTAANHLKSLPMAKLMSSKKARLLNFIASLFPGWRFTIIARKM